MAFVVAEVMAEAVAVEEAVVVVAVAVEVAVVRIKSNCYQYILIRVEVFLNRHLHNTKPPYYGLGPARNNSYNIRLRAVCLLSKRGHNYTKTRPKRKRSSALFSSRFFLQFA